jgi:hypothetical protein
MKRMSTLSHCVYREKSQFTGQLVEAMCAASLEFLPLVYDEVGYDEDGNEYHYASLTAINKATKAALCKHGVYLHTDYGFDEEGMYATAVLEHKSGEFIGSFIRIKEYMSIHRQKAAMTLMRRTAVEGLLNISAEADDDAQCCASEDKHNAAVAEVGPVVDPKAVKREEMARSAIEVADTPERVEEIMTKVIQMIDAGMMLGASMNVLKPVASARLKELNPQEVVA